MRLLLTALAAVLYALGWMAGKASLAVGWCWSAIAVGWDESRTSHSSAEPARAGPQGR